MLALELVKHVTQRLDHSEEQTHAPFSAQLIVLLHKVLLQSQIQQQL